MVAARMAEAYFGHFQRHPPKGLKSRLTCQKP